MRLRKALLRTSETFLVAGGIFAFAIGGGKLLHAYGWPVAVAMGAVFFVALTVAHYRVEGDE